MRCCGKMQRQLHLTTVRHPALKGIGALEDAADVSLIVSADRLHHLAVDHVVRKVRAQPHIGDGVEQQQGREKVVGDAVAMRFELNRNAFLVRDRHPGLDRLGHVVNRERHDLADDNHEGRADVLGEMEGGTQFFDAARERGQQASQSGPPELGNERARRHYVQRAEIDRHAVEARRAHAIEPLGNWSLRRAGASQFGGPQRLIDAQAHAQACLAGRTRGATGSRSVSSLIQIASSG